MVEGEVIVHLGWAVWEWGEWGYPAQKVEL